MSGLVTLTTDFGTRDPYAGIMKGVLYSSNPNVTVIDITHDIAPHDIIDAAFTLARVFEYFPAGTVHVAVVDPEVGGQRKNVALKTDRSIFIGPDNGIFAMVLEKTKPNEIREITNPPFILDKISSTFHGRDVYAPCAGHLSSGKNFGDVGPVVERLKKLDFPEITYKGNVLIGEVIAIDSFGNLITNISRHSFKSFIGRQNAEIFFGPERFQKIMDHYSEVPKGSPLALFGSSGHLEISMNEGNAASYFMTAKGCKVSVRKS
ncbi:SAM-dependent chlorinase/fluorinase [bacterium]|nr:SAM-dependent chlorinase/fluorinase [bacterium]